MGMRKKGEGEVALLGYMLVRFEALGIGRVLIVGGEGGGDIVVGVVVRAVWGCGGSGEWWGW